MITALACTGAVLYMFWHEGAFLPRWISWDSGVFCDASGQYEITLEDKMTIVSHDGNVIWDSPDGLKVQQALSCDIDHDRADELVLLCWKVGRYGTSKPFWVERDEKKWSQHIFVYEYDKGKIKPKWMSSYIGQDVVRMSVYGGSADTGEPEGRTAGNDLQDDNDRSGKARIDGRQDALRADRRIRLLLTNPDGRTSSWIWDSWGFTKEDREVSFAVCGDNLIHEPIYRYGLHNGGKFDFLYENVRDVIRQSDIAVINQETPLTDDPSMYGGYPRFGTPAGVGEAVADAGFDVVACATNHALDRGIEGVNFTKKFFDSHEITCLGIQSAEEQEYRPCEVVVKNGIRFAMLNYTYGTNGIRIPEEYPDMVHLLEDEDKISRDIRDAKAKSDFVLVFVHWGTEYEEEPDDFQKKWAGIFLENGVDVVVGTHPHALQPYEVLQDEGGHEMLVYYSIGNFVSAQYEESCVKGGMARFTVSLTADGYRVSEYTLQPLTITQEAGKYTVGFGL